MIQRTLQYLKRQCYYPIDKNAYGTYATLRISRGDNILDVSKQLGHHSVKITLDTYTHWMPGGKKSEVDELDGHKAPGADCGQGKAGVVNED